MIFFNGKVYTKKSFFQAICLQDGKIVDYGTNDTILKLYPHEETWDLKERLMLPGFIDSHMHLLNYAMNKDYIDLKEATSIAMIVLLLKEYLKNHPNRIMAFGYNDENCSDGRLINRFDLDQISSEIPIIVKRVCGHIACVNSKALLQSAIPPLSSISFGQIDVDEKGELLGIFREQALEYLDWKPVLSVSEIKDFIKSALIDANACGLTSISTNDMSEDEEEAEKILKAYQELEKENHLTIRINHQVTFTNTTFLTKLNACFQTSSFLKMGPIKLFMDGSLGGKTALLKTHYLNSEEKGILCLDLNQFENMLIYCKKHRRQIIVHAIGNKAIDICLDYYKKYQDSRNSLRWGIVHVQITDEEIMHKFALQQICGFVQPPFIMSDMELVKRRVPQDLVSTSYLFSTLARITPTGFGSDCPVEDFNPLLGIYAMVTRANWEYRQFYQLSERQTVEEAVLGYTKTNAYLTFEENLKGEIKKGYMADLVVLDQDIFSIPQKDIKNVKVEMTIVNGKIVYEREKNDAKKLLF